MNDVISYSGWIGHNNIGDEALYMANKKLFPKHELVNKEYYDQADVVLYGGGTVLPRPKYPEQQTSQLAAAIGVGVKDPEFRNRPLTPIDIGYYLERNGLGHCLSNTYLGHGLRQVTKLSKHISINQKYIDKDLFEPLKEMKHLGVRGPLSKEILSRYDIDCQVIGDTALVLEPSTYCHQKTKKVVVTLKAESADMKWSEDKQYIDVIETFCQNHSDEYTFVFMPFFPGDIPLHIELAENVENSEFKDYCSYIDVQAAIDEIADCDLVIGERLHASVFGACSYTPFISVGYQPKNEDFANSIGMDEYHTRVDNLTSSWMESRLSDIQDREHNSLLKSKVNEKRSKITEFAGDILDAIVSR